MNTSSKLIFSIIYLIVDICWITTMSKLFYKENIEIIQKSIMKPKIIPAILAYLTLLVCMFYICIPLSKQYEEKHEAHPSIIFGLVGFIMYAIYNFTNGTIFTNYTWQFMCIDTLWGTLSFSVFGLLYTYLR